MKLKFTLCLFALSLALAPRAFSFRLLGESWTKDVPVVMQLSLTNNGVSTPLNDGLPSFNASAADALNTWNSHLAHLQFSVVENPNGPRADGDGQNSVFFSSTV